MILTIQMKIIRSLLERISIWIRRKLFLALGFKNLNSQDYIRDLFTCLLTQWIMWADFMDLLILWHFCLILYLLILTLEFQQYNYLLMFSESMKRKIRLNNQNRNKKWNKLISVLYSTDTLSLSFKFFKISFAFLNIVYYEIFILNKKKNYKAKEIIKKIKIH